MVLLTFSVTLTLGVNTYAQGGETCYVWSDPNGGRHYGSIPPPDVAAETVTCKHKSTTKDVNSEFDAETLAKKRAAREQREAQCNQEKNRLSTLQASGAVIRMKDAEGNVKTLTKEEIDAEVSLSKNFIDKNCN